MLGAAERQRELQERLEVIMRRIILALIALVSICLALPSAHPPRVAAQEGVSVEVLGRGLPPEASGQQLTLLRATFAPGSLLPMHRHPGPMLLYIESGALGYTLADWTAEIVRAAVAGSNAPPEILSPGQETILQVGDQLLERGVTHAAHNAGSVPAIVLISALLTPGQPVTTLVDAPPHH